MNDVKTSLSSDILMPTIQVPEVEASDIQATVLRPRPSPYRGEYVILRIDQA